jgi:hypothetical protein
MTQRPLPVSSFQRAVLSPWLMPHPVPSPPPQARSAVLWGEPGVARMAAHAAAAVAGGMSVAIIDGAMAFDVTTITAYA